MKNLKVAFFGTPEFIEPVREVLKRNFNLVADLSHPNELNDQFIRHLAQIEPDLIVVAAFGKIIPKSVLEIPKKGTINIHPSLLPKYRGASPIQSALLNGEKESGITFILMDEQMDHGPIIYQETFEFSRQDNFDTLSKSMFQKASEKLKDVIIEYINDSIVVTPQDDTSATFCKMIKKSDGFFDIESPPSILELDRLIRAFYPWPTAWTRFKGKIVKLLPGNLVQIEGKRPTDLKSFLNGYPDFPLKQLTSNDRKV